MSSSGGALTDEHLCGGNGVRWARDGAVFADLGKTTGSAWDNELKKIEAIRGGQMAIYTSGDSRDGGRNKDDGRLTSHTDRSAGVRQGGRIFIAVGTPPRRRARPTSRKWRRSRPRSAAPWTAYKVVVTSRPVPGWDGRVRPRGHHAATSAPPRRRRGVNPEFLRGGLGDEDTLRPDRIVIAGNQPAGGHDPRRAVGPLERR